MYQSTVPFLVEATGFEPTTFASRTLRATSCATPRFFQFFIYFRKWSSSILWAVFEKEKSPETFCFKTFSMVEAVRSVATE